jgi:hypothetical protein
VCDHVMFVWHHNLAVQETMLANQIRSRKLLKKNMKENAKLKKVRVAVRTRAHSYCRVAVYTCTYCHIVGCSCCFFRRTRPTRPRRLLCS